MKIIPLFLVFSILACFLFLLSALATEENEQQAAFLIDVQGVIDLGLSGFIERALAEAQKTEAELIILDIDTFGGRVDAATDICDSLARVSTVPTVAFITGEAWSAGALISLACKKIVMVPGSSIGSAEPRSGAMSNMEHTDEKMISALRAKFKAVAEQNGHSVNLAQAMVDKDIELRLVNTNKGQEILTEEEWLAKSERYRKRTKARVLVAKDKLLNLTAQEAKELGLADAVLATKEELLEFVSLPKARILSCRLNWSEVLVRWLTHPLLSSFLLTIGFLGLLFELRIPGWGISGTIGLLALALFFWGHYLIGLANWLEIFLFLLGVGLLALEIFVIPGFGLAGLGGIILIVISLFLALIKHPFEIPRRELLGAFYIIGYSFIVSVLLAYLGLRWLPKSKLWQRLVLEEEEQAASGYSQTRQWEQYLGRQGVSITALHPTGKVEISGQILDVVTEGDFLAQGDKVQIVKVEGNRIVVRGV